MVGNHTKSTQTADIFHVSLGRRFSHILSWRSWIGRWHNRISSAVHLLIPVWLSLRLHCSLWLTFLVKNGPKIWDHGIDILSGWFTLTRNVYSPKVALLGESDLIFLSCHDRGIHGTLEVLALVLFHDFPANIVERLCIIPWWWRRPVISFIDTFRLLYLHKDFLPNLIKRHLFSGLSASNDIIQSSIYLDIGSW